MGSRIGRLNARRAGLGSGYGLHAAADGGGPSSGSSHDASRKTRVGRDLREGQLTGPSVQDVYPACPAIRMWLNSEPFPVQARGNLLHLFPLPDVGDAGPVVALVLAALVVLVMALLRPAPDSAGPRTLGAFGHRSSSAGRWTAAGFPARQPADVCRTSREDRRGESLVDSLRPVVVPVRLAALFEGAGTTPPRAPGLRPDPAAGPGRRPSTFPRPPRDAGSSAGPQAPPG